MDRDGWSSSSTPSVSGDDHNIWLPEVGGITVQHQQVEVGVLVVVAPLDDKPVAHVTAHLFLGMGGRKPRLLDNMKTV